MKRTHLLISSKDRVAGDSNNFIVNTPQITKCKNVIVNNIEMVSSFYNITSKNNTLQFAILQLLGQPIPTLEEKFPISKSGITSYTVTIPTGNYTASSLASQLQTSMNGITSSSFFTISYNSNSFKMSFQYNRSDYTFIIDTQSSLAYNLGFRGTGSFFASNIGGTVTETIPSALIDLRVPIIYIHSNVINQQQLNSKKQSKPILTKLQLTQPIGSTNYFYRDFNEDGLYECIPAISQLQFSLKNDNDDILDNNGLDWSIGLIIEHEP